jgi:hypothetical protein
MRRAALLTLAMLASAQAVAAGCAGDGEPIDERRFGGGAEAITVQLCHDGKPLPAGPAGSLEVTASRGDRTLAQLRLPIDVEGDLRKIRFDGATYALGDQLPAISVVLEARLRGSTFDQYSTDLWLIRFDGKALSLVLARSVGRESWGTNCDPDCISTTDTETLVIVAPGKSKQGLHDLRLRTRSRKSPRSSDRIERLVFDGQRYESASP